MTNVAILGLGLMGGSLGLALKKRSDVRVTGYTRSAERGRLAMERGAVDVMADSAADAARDADIVVLCAPILAIPAQLESVIPTLKPGAIVTDVGSTKEKVQTACSVMLEASDAVFVGSHPICGSEQQGMDAADVDLYDGAMVVITPEEGKAEEAAQLEELWKTAGSHVFTMSPAEHDRILALTSHLPHLMASILSLTVGRDGLREDLREFCGTGFKDTSRVAKGGTDIWLDILKTNDRAVLDELKAFRENLDSFIEKLDEKDFVAIEGALESARKFRESCD